MKKKEYEHNGGKKKSIYSGELVDGAKTARSLVGKLFFHFIVTINQRLQKSRHGSSYISIEPRVETSSPLKPIFPNY